MESDRQKNSYMINQDYLRSIHPKYKAMMEIQNKDEVVNIKCTKYILEAYFMFRAEREDLKMTKEDDKYVITFSDKTTIKISV